jgi:hypothetical protein
MLSLVHLKLLDAKLVSKRLLHGVTNNCDSWHSETLHGLLKLFVRNGFLVDMLDLFYKRIPKVINLFVFDRKRSLDAIFRDETVVVCVNCFKGH